MWWGFKLGKGQLPIKPALKLPSDLRPLEDGKSTLETSGEDEKSTLETSGEDGKNALETSVKVDQFRYWFWPIPAGQKIQ